MNVIAQINPDPPVEPYTLSKEFRRALTRAGGGCGRIHIGHPSDRLRNAAMRRGLAVGRFKPFRFGSPHRRPVRGGGLGYYWVIGWKAGRDQRGDRRYEGCVKCYEEIRTNFGKRQAN